jgi:hypothetical protein
MTTKVTITNDNVPGYPMRIQIEPQRFWTGVPVPHEGATLAAGETASFYVHSDRRLVITEVLPDPLVVPPVTPV